MNVENYGYEVTTDSLCKSFNYPIDSLYFNKQVISDWQKSKWRKQGSQYQFTLDRLTSRVEFASGRAVI